MTETYYSILGVIRQFLDNAPTATQPFSQAYLDALNAARLRMQTATSTLSNAIRDFHNAMEKPTPQGGDSISEAIIDAINHLEHQFCPEYKIDPSLAKALLCVRQKLQGEECDIGGGNDPEPVFSKGTGGLISSSSSSSTSGGGGGGSDCRFAR